MESIHNLKEYYKLIEELWNDRRVEKSVNTDRACSGSQQFCSRCPVNERSKPVQFPGWYVNTLLRRKKMGKPRDTKKDVKKKAAKTIKEKRKEKQEKKKNQ